jgi:hypothetical protein
MIDFAILACAMLIGAGNAPLPLVLMPAALLTLAGLRRDQDLVAQFTRLGGVRVLSLGLAFSAASNLLFALIAFYLGRCALWLAPLALLPR